MSSKKKTSGKKKKAGKPGDNENEQLQKLKDELKRSNLRVETLERYLVLRTEQTHRAQAEQQDMRERMRDVDEDAELEKEERLSIAADMVRQYKSMQDDLLTQINDLSNKKLHLKDQLALANLTLEQTKKERDQELEKKDQEIIVLKQKMQDMVSEFGDMLRETLEKMGTMIQQQQQQHQQPEGISSQLLNNEKLREILGGNTLQLL